MLASLRGLVVRGPIDGARARASSSCATGSASRHPVDRDVALAELARRYLAGHGPADDRDLAKWAGLPLRDARAGLSAIASELDERDRAGSSISRGGRRRRELPPPRLLGPFEPLLLGWRSREPVLGAHTGVVTLNGIFRPIALVRGRAVGTWRLVGRCARAGAVRAGSRAPTGPRSHDDAARRPPLPRRRGIAVPPDEFQRSEPHRPGPAGREEGADMKIGIIGAGQHRRHAHEAAVGRGHEVAVANSRGPETLARPRRPRPAHTPVPVVGGRRAARRSSWCDPR